MSSIPEYDLDTGTWHKSSYSGGSGGNCLEVADGNPTIIPVRDSKNPRGPKLAFRPEAWSAFLEAVKAP
ncbi:hypothetical protein SLINC_3849 [Streptomyces lincolnensis]|uniref:DUF397 domain-containing protein n=1 Tax=Streptomyces lincolnensis TaxID=1915 RepID=Q9KKD6_STRLN|nr:DUF397 domain-containing protein [Streptomyces lincolnensis]AAF86302.1 hypothetical protein [Streptomyces lincolnensis]ANS66073.1 hypothetical protein SLINC_3849 [Streptomyces lincolnensis]AXG54163.1 hypothetical protein SLCG_3008 [Streptomyces lincolnensis]QMV08538.1 DUF397 domain-containing protein [Streptomyces lincolnensis]